MHFAIGLSKLQLGKQPRGRGGSLSASLNSIYLTRCCAAGRSLAEGCCCWIKKGNYGSARGKTRRRWRAKFRIAQFGWREQRRQGVCFFRGYFFAWRGEGGRDREKERKRSKKGLEIGFASLRRQIFDGMVSLSRREPDAHEVLKMALVSRTITSDRTVHDKSLFPFLLNSSARHRWIEIIEKYDKFIICFASVILKYT